MYRHLSQEEIRTLEANGCLCENWDDVQVSWGDACYTDRIVNVTFSGRIRLGSFEGYHTFPGGISLRNGVRNAFLHNVTLGDRVLVRKTGEYIANYEIGDDSLVDNVDVLAVEGETAFGNGVEVSVLSETGGREVVMTDNLSAHTAYMMAMYRHRGNLHGKISALAKAYADGKRSRTGKVGRHVRICNCGVITDVAVGDHAEINGAMRLHDGSINSNEYDPVTVGSGVRAEHFIFSSGSQIESNALLTRCFVGQACKLGHGYSASDSLFFSNCQGENGEACAIFAGPFTVTHHKSTLLIAGMFSFMNAGSGSNQSNHMYKLGPIHQGILERGARTASDSYILWPSRVGPFSLVMGRHVTHSDTTNLPFSYLIEKNNTTFLAPGVNLRSVGTIRDAQKWPRRDARKDPNRLDCINFNLLSPFTIQKMFKGLKTLENLRYASGQLSDLYSFHSAKITNSALNKGIGFYHTGIRKFLGNSLIKRLETLPAGATDAQMQAMLRPDTEIGKGMWVDISGLIAPRDEVGRLLEDIVNGTVTSMEEINVRFRQMHEHYYEYEWTWAYDRIGEYFGVVPSQMTRQQVIDIVQQWKEAVVGLDRMVYEDARKEFSLSAMTGYGADGEREHKEQDFENVRGDFDSNPFVKEILDHIDRKTRLGEELVERLGQ
jgi:hypothetical protein